MSLMSNLRSKDKKGIFTYDNTFTNYSTGFLPLDYVNAFKTYSVDEDGKTKVTIQPGVMSGRFITIIGSSGGGKTTLATQIGYNIIKDYEDGALIFVDCEHSSFKPRLEQITHSDRDERIVLNDEDAYIETVMAQVSAIAKEKESMGDAAKYDADGSAFGKKTIRVYAPTVVIIDSLPSFVSEDTKVDELEGGMSNNRETKEIGQFYKKLLGVCAKYNIIIIAINHLRPKIKASMFDFSKPQLMMLKDDECLPRGEAPIFYASTMFRMNPSAAKSKAFTEEEHGFDGFLCSVQVAKSKTAFIGGEVNLVFREDIGYDPIYSIYQFAYDAGLIEGRNPYLHIKGADEYRFSKKNFRELFETDEEFKTAILAAIQPALDAIAGCKDTDDAISNIDPSKVLQINDKGELESTISEKGETVQSIVTEPKPVKKPESKHTKVSDMIDEALQ